MLKSFGYIMLFLVLGESLRYLFNVPVAGNILGMALIFLALRMKVVTLDLVKPAANKLLKYMVLFFVPYGVGLMAHFDLIKDHWVALGLVVAVGTFLTLILTGYIQQTLEK